MARGPRPWHQHIDGSKKPDKTLLPCLTQLMIVSRQMNVYIKTFGCPLNKFDSIKIEGSLRYLGCQITNDASTSNIIIVNSCGVKKQTEDKVIDYLKLIKRRYPEKKILLAGCLPKINPQRINKEKICDKIFGPTEIGDLIKYISSIIELRKKLDIDDIRVHDYIPMKNSITYPLGVSSGCLDKCSFCGTRNARGIVKSMELEKIRKIIVKLIERGYKEILLTSTDLGAYGFDLKPRRNMIDLLRMISDIDRDFIVRVGMANPRWIYKWLDELIEIFKSSNKFYHFLHIPVQSGSDELLVKMNRGHGTMEYIESVKRMRREISPLFTISTDIIVGHPGETDKDFELTLDILKESMPDYVNISKFFPRPNTPAKMMKQISTKIIKERSREATKLTDKIMLERNLMWRGWRGPILVNEYGKGDTFMGRNYAYKIFVVKGNYKPGDIVNVRFKEAHSTWIEGDTDKVIYGNGGLKAFFPNEL